jgi:hypothetical protein
MRGTPRVFASVPLVSGAVAARLQTACECGGGGGGLHCTGGGTAIRLGPSRRALVSHV